MSIVTDRQSSPGANTEGARIVLLLDGPEAFILAPAEVREPVLLLAGQAWSQWFTQRMIEVGGVRMVGGAFGPVNKVWGLWTVPASELAQALQVMKSVLAEQALLAYARIGFFDEHTRRFRGWYPTNEDLSERFSDERIEEAHRDQVALTEFMRRLNWSLDAMLGNDPGQQ